MGCNPAMMVDPLGLQSGEPGSLLTGGNVPGSSGWGAISSYYRSMLGPKSQRPTELQGDLAIYAMMRILSGDAAGSASRMSAGGGGGMLTSYEQLAQIAMIRRGWNATIQERSKNVSAKYYSLLDKYEPTYNELPPLTVIDRKADWVQWGRRMNDLYGFSLGFNFSGYGYQSSGMNIWQAARADGRIREEIERSKSETLARAGKAGYLPFRSDAAGITLNYNLIGISGGAGSITIGYVGNDLGIWTTNGVAVGIFDVSWGVSIFNAEYRGEGVPNMESYMGTGRSGGLGVGPFSIGYSQGLNSQNVPVWHSYAGGVTIGARNVTMISGQYQPYNYTAPVYKW